MIVAWELFYHGDMLFQRREGVKRARGRSLTYLNNFPVYFALAMQADRPAQLPTFGQSNNGTYPRRHGLILRSNCSRACSKADTTRRAFMKTSEVLC
jgi:hypothetical protein